MKPRDQILSRMYIVLTVLSIFPVLVGAQVLRIVFVEGKRLRAQGEQQASSRVEIPAMRGAILDRSDRVLAVNTARYELALDPEVEGFTPAVAATFFEKLSRLTRKPASFYSRKVRSRTSPRYVLLLRDLSERQKEEIESWGMPGLLLHPSFARRYNYGKTGAHLLGHVDVSGQGIAGLELQYDKHLRGEPGMRAVKLDRLRRIKAFVGGKVIEPRHGESIVLTVDLIRQTILEEELALGVAESGARWGTAIAMDPHTGAVLALANMPTYDPNQPGRWPVEALRNHGITDRIEPGSTFKLVAAVAALEQGIIRMEDTVDTGPGYAVFHRRTMRDTHAHGKITFSDVIAFSSNIGVAMTASRLKPGIFYQYARNMGFGQPSWIDLPGEIGGLLKKPDQWSGTSLTSMSIGYEVNVTPLQILTAYCALANGGLLVHPYVVAERRDVTGRTVWTASLDSVRRAFKPETAAKLIPAFEKVVEDGTAKKAQIEGLPVAGKTGTALKAVGGSYRSGKYRGTFVGFFPADDPVVALIVVMDEPNTSGYGGIVAAPVFQAIARRWIGTFPQLAARVAPSPELPEHPAQPVPGVVGRPAAVAASVLRAAGFEAAGPDDAESALRTVAAQQPEAGAESLAGAKVRLQAAAADTLRLMPDLKGLSARQATFWLAALGVDLEVEGSGMVVGQQPEAGAALPGRARIRCQ